MFSPTVKICLQTWFQGAIGGAETYNKGWRKDLGSCGGSGDGSTLLMLPIQAQRVTALNVGQCEIYGRRYVLCAANVFFCVWQIGCALAPNLNSLIAFRFLAGIGGSGCMTIGGGVVADLFPPDQRGLATSLYTLGPLFGPTLGKWHFLP